MNKTYTPSRLVEYLNDFSCNRNVLFAFHRLRWIEYSASTVCGYWWQVLRLLLITIPCTVVLSAWMVMFAVGVILGIALAPELPFPEYVTYTDVVRNTIGALTVAEPSWSLGFLFSSFPVTFGVGIGCIAILTTLMFLIAALTVTLILVPIGYIVHNVDARIRIPISIPIPACNTQVVKRKKGD